MASWFARVGRVAIAFALGATALWLLAAVLESLAQPFSSLSPLSLIGAVLSGSAGVALLALGCVSAFGGMRMRDRVLADEGQGWNGLP